MLDEIADVALLLRLAERARDAVARETTTAQANEIARRCSHYRAELDRLLSEYFA